MNTSKLILQALALILAVFVAVFALGGMASAATWLLLDVLFPLSPVTL